MADNIFYYRINVLKKWTIASYFEFLTHNWERIILKSKIPNLTEPEDQALVWKEFKDKPTKVKEVKVKGVKVKVVKVKEVKVKEVPSFELNNPILDKMKKSREVHLNTCNKNEKSEPKIGPAISPAIEKAKSDQPAENIKQNGNRQLSPAPRK